MDTYLLDKRTREIKEDNKKNFDKTKIMIGSLAGGLVINIALTAIILKKVL